MSRSSTDLSHSQPNLTPLLDMVFQLITFFMLVINFKEASLDQSLELPVLGSARPIDTKGQDDLLVLNIDRQGRLTERRECEQGPDEREQFHVHDRRWRPAQSFVEPSSAARISLMCW